MLETLLTYGEDAKKSQLSAELFYKDDAGEMDTTITAPAIDTSRTRACKRVART